MLGAWFAIKVSLAAMTTWLWISISVDFKSKLGEEIIFTHTMPCQCQRMLYKYEFIFRHTHFWWKFSSLAGRKPKETVNEERNLLIGLFTEKINTLVTLFKLLSNTSSVYTRHSNLLQVQLFRMTLIKTLLNGCEKIINQEKPVNYFSWRSDPFGQVLLCVPFRPECVFNCDH